MVNIILRINRSCAVYGKYSGRLDLHMEHIETYLLGNKWDCVLNGLCVRVCVCEQLIIRSYRRRFVCVSV